MRVELEGRFLSHGRNLKPMLTAVFGENSGEKNQSVALIAIDGVFFRD